MKSETDVLIIGAGLTGLSTAWHLRNSGKNVRIIEASDSIGGHAKTEVKSGFRFDHTGHLLHLRDEKIRKWIIGDLFKNKIPKMDRISRIWSSGVYTRYPFQANTFGLPDKIAKECIEEYLKVIDKPPKKKIRTAEDFIYRHFGKGFAKHFMIPYNKKIWGIHPKYMSATWGERFVPIPKKSEVLAGMEEGSDLKLGYNSSFFYPKTGIGEIPKRIYDQLKKYYTAEFNTSVSSISMKDNLVILSTGEEIRYKYLVNTMPLDGLVRHISDSTSELKSLVKKLRCKSLYYLDIALNVESRHKFHWCYIPSLKIPFYRVGIYSNFSSKIAPKGKSSLYVELSTRNYSEDMLPSILNVLKEMGFIKNKKEVEFVIPHFIKCAYVVYDSNYFKVVPRIHKILNNQNIFSIGRWGSWNYSSMEDALLMGRETAEKIK